MIDDNGLNYDYLLKYIIIGDVSVGKSNLLLNYVHGQFRENHNVTIGIDFAAKTEKIRDKAYRIQIWDTAGQENFRSIAMGYYKNSVCALIVYDISRRDSFEHVSDWIEKCINYAPKSITMVLVGNKSDLEDKRIVSEEEGKQLAEQHGILFYETSAKTGKNVNDIFYKSVDEIATKIEENGYNLESPDCGIKLGGGGVRGGDDNKLSKKKKCC